MIERIKNPAKRPVGLDGIKAHLRLDHAIEDDYLLGLIDAATDMVERFLNRSLITQQWRLTVSHPFRPIKSVDLLYPPLQNVDQVVGIFVNDEKIPLEKKCIETKNSVPKLHLESSSLAVEVTYTAGFGDSAKDIPESIKQAIKLQVAEFYENRDLRAVPGNTMIRTLLVPFQVKRLV